MLDVDPVREVALPHALGAHEQLVDRAGDRPRQRQPHDERDDLDDQEQAGDDDQDDEDQRRLSGSPPNMTLCCACASCSIELAEPVAHRDGGAARRRPSPSPCCRRTPRSGRTATQRLVVAVPASAARSVDGLFAPSLTLIVPALTPVASCRREIISASIGTSTTTIAELRRPGAPPRTTSSCLPGDSGSGMAMVPVKPRGFADPGRQAGRRAWHVLPSAGASRLRDASPADRDEQQRQARVIQAAVVRDAAARALRGGFAGVRPISAAAASASSPRSRRSSS